MIPNLKQIENDVIGLARMLVAMNTASTEEKRLGAAFLVGGMIMVLKQDVNGLPPEVAAGILALAGSSKTLTDFILGAFDYKTNAEFTVALMAVSRKITELFREEVVRLQTEKGYGEMDWDNIVWKKTEEAPLDVL